MNKFKNQLNSQEVRTVAVVKQKHLAAYLLDKSPFSVHTYGILLSIAGVFGLTQILSIVIPSTLDLYVPAGIAACFIFYQIRMFKVLPDDKPAAHNTLGITLLCMLGGFAVHIFYGAILGLGIAYWFHYASQHGNKIKSWADDIKEKAAVTVQDTKDITSSADKWEAFKDTAGGCAIAVINGGLIGWAGYEFLPDGAFRYLIVGVGTCIFLSAAGGVAVAFFELCKKGK